MEGHCYLLYMLLALLAPLFAVHMRRRGRGADPALRLPPGPWELPVIGSLHHIAGRLPHRALRDLARRHGPVMLLRVGEVPTLVVSSREAAREVLKTHDVAFASRRLSATLRAMTDGGRDMMFAPYGDRWRQLRKVAIVELLSARRVLSFRAVRAEEVSAMLRAAAAAAASRAALDMRAALATLVADTTMRAAVGDRCRHRDALLRVLEHSISLAGGFNPADLWPSSRLVGWLSGAVGGARECRDAVSRILDSIIDDHLERMDKQGSEVEAVEVEDLLLVLLKIHRDGTLDIPLDMDAIKHVIFDIFAGSETSSVVLEWAMAELIRNPRTMERAAAEVRWAFASRGAVAEDALGELRYLHHVVRETFRLHVPVPLLVPRVCREPCCVLGYDVPPGATVLVNAWALGRDGRYWPGGDAEEFRPERFEEGEAVAAVDLRGADFELLPFGAGRRMCPGMPFGLAVVEHALASLLLHFDWELVDGPAAEMDMTEEFGITVRRKKDLLLRPILRVPVPDHISL